MSSSSSSSWYIFDLRIPPAVERSFSAEGLELCRLHSRHQRILALLQQASPVISPFVCATQLETSDIIPVLVHALTLFVDDVSSGRVELRAPIDAPRVLVVAPSNADVAALSSYLARFGALLFATLRSAFSPADEGAAERTTGGRLCGGLFCPWADCLPTANGPSPYTPLAAEAVQHLLDRGEPLGSYFLFSTPRALHDAVRKDVAPSSGTGTAVDPYRVSQLYSRVKLAVVAGADKLADDATLLDHSLAPLRHRAQMVFTALQPARDSDDAQAQKNWIFMEHCISTFCDCVLDEQSHVRREFVPDESDGRQPQAAAGDVRDVAVIDPSAVAATSASWNKFPLRNWVVEVQWEQHKAETLEDIVASITPTIRSICFFASHDRAAAAMREMQRISTSAFKTFLVSAVDEEGETAEARLVAAAAYMRDSTHGVILITDAACRSFRERLPFTSAIQNAGLFLVHADVPTSAAQVRARLDVLQSPDDPLPRFQAHSAVAQCVFIGDQERCSALRVNALEYKNPRAAPYRFMSESVVRVFEDACGGGCWEELPMDTSVWWNIKNG